VVFEGLVGGGVGRFESFVEGFHFPDGKLLKFGVGFS